MLKGKSTVIKSTLGSNLYILVPAKMVSDSSFNLAAGDTVELEFLPSRKLLIVKKSGDPN